MADLGPLKPLDSINKDANLWKRDEHDWYVEPSWTSKRLFEEEVFHGTIWDPACGGGRIIREAQKAGFDTRATDIVDRSPICQEVDNFLSRLDYAENIVSNPPFGIADDFVKHALFLAVNKVAMLLPTKWMNSDTRGRWLRTTPLYRVWLLTPRPSMPPGAVVATGAKVGGGTVDFAWFVWLRGYDGEPELHWLHRDK